LLTLALFFFIYLGNYIETSSKQYSESGTTGSGQKIVNKTAPVGMSVNFRIHFSVLVFVCGICVYYIANIKPNTNKYTKVMLILRKVRRNQRSNQKS
jgi:F0F1-type ATP synthase membrane subunit a